MLHTIFRQPAFESSAKKIFGTIKGADGQLEDLDWSFARETSANLAMHSPVGQTHDGHTLRLYKNHAGLVVLFHVDPACCQVVFHNIFRASTTAQILPLQATGSQP